MLHLEIYIGANLSSTTLILLGAGNSSRFKTTVKKQWIYTDETPLWMYVAEHFENTATFDEIIIVSTPDEIKEMKKFANYLYVQGGNSRQSSLNNALKLVTSDYVLVSDIARCCIPSDMILRILAEQDKASCVVPTLNVTDTLYLNSKPIDREKAKIIQTPQLSRTRLLKKALQTDILFSDDSSAIVSLGEPIHFVQGSTKAHKLTTLEDLEKLTCLKAPSRKTRIGFGIDTHPFKAGKKMFLCGTPIDVHYGFMAHSDGDVAIHSLIDALLGAAGMGDIGELYPDTDDTYAGVDSKVLLTDTVKRINAFGFSIGNIDMTIMAEIPKLLPYKEKMRESLSSLLNLRSNFINIKASTSEELGFIGRKEGVTVHTIVNLTYTNWKTL